MTTSSSGDQPAPEDLTEYERADFPHGIPASQSRMPEGGAASARSALTLRLVLAAFGLVVCVVSAVLTARADVPVVVTVALLVLAAFDLVDLVVLARRKLRGEPG